MPYLTPQRLSTHMYVKPIKPLKPSSFWLAAGWIDSSFANRLAGWIESIKPQASQPATKLSWIVAKYGCIQQTASSNHVEGQPVLP